MTETLPVTGSGHEALRAWARNGWRDAPQGQWVGVAWTALSDAGLAGRASGALELVQKRFSTAVRGALAPRDVFSPLVRDLAAGGAEFARLNALLGVMLSAHPSETETERTVVLRAAATLCEAALRSGGSHVTTGVAVRLARLRGDLGDRAGAHAAWAEAYRRDVLLGWAMGSGAQDGVDATALEEHARWAGAASERGLRGAVLGLRVPSERDNALVTLDQLAAGGVSEAAFVRAVEHLADMVRSGPGTAGMRAHGDAAERLLAGIAGVSVAVELLRALVSVAEGKLQVAGVLLTQGLRERLGLGEVSAADAQSVVHELTRMLRDPRVSPREILQRAYFDAVLDPLTALQIPRGTFASLKRFLAGMALATMVTTGSGALFATGCAGMPGGGDLAATSQETTETPAPETGTAVNDEWQPRHVVDEGGPTELLGGMTAGEAVQARPAQWSAISSELAPAGPDVQVLATRRFLLVMGDEPMALDVQTGERMEVPALSALRGVGRIVVASDDAIAGWRGADGVRLDLETLRVETIQADAHPTSLGGEAVVADGGNVIVLGGSTAQGYAAQGAILRVSSGRWDEANTANALSPRTHPTATAIGGVGHEHEIVVFGGLGPGSAGPLGDGAVYDAQANLARPLAQDGAMPSARAYHTAVWTGRELVVWGGLGSDGDALGDGAAYDPTTGQWRRVSSQGAPSARRGHVAVWTGTRMVVWGGENSEGQALDDGAVYDPATDQWTRLRTEGTPLAGRAEASAVWAGNQMVIVGGRVGMSYQSGGARLVFSQ